ncbi:hypothetical protein ETB97_000298 [Aspergillus alliaceus]|uniref:Uncharacterized protein n=1 Tax=Petromyces alliaceus TaxID=209559 RepID=A0A8H6E6M8_PETAA|nr:hypothetical protein ETB97_000298 [Aspergillus burnettii]
MEDCVYQASNNHIDTETLTKLLRLLVKMQDFQTLYGLFKKPNSPLFIFGFHLLVCAAGYENIVRVLVMHPARKSHSSDLTALMAAYSNGDHRIVEPLLEFGVGPNLRSSKAWRTALDIAVRKCHYEIAEMRLEAGINPDGKKLVRNGADVNGPLAPVERNTALQAAASTIVDGKTDEIGSGPQFQVDNSTCIVSMMGLLMRTDAAMKPYVPQYGNTALHEAIICGDLEAVHFLISNGANVNVGAFMKSLHTSLQEASWQRH